MSRNRLFIFTTREAYLLAGASMFMGLSLSLVLQGLSARVTHPVNLDRLIMLAGELLILLPPWLILRQRKIAYSQVIPRQPITPQTGIMALVLVAGAIGMTAVFEALMLPYFPMPDFMQQMQADLETGSTWDTGILIVTAVLAAPLVEEFLFRGILQNSLYYRYGSLLPAMVIPTVIFSLFHVAYLFYLPALLELMALALMLAWLMVKTGNLLIPIMVHGLFNLSAFIDLVIPSDDELASVADLGWPWIIVSILLLAVGWFYFRHVPAVVSEEVYLIPPLQDEELG